MWFLKDGLQTVVFEIKVLTDGGTDGRRDGQRLESHLINSRSHRATFQPRPYYVLNNSR